MAFTPIMMDGLDLVYAAGFLESVPTNLPIYLFCGSSDPVSDELGFDRLVQSFKTLGSSISNPVAMKGPGTRRSTNSTRMR
jgi:hypothetical protein